MGLTVREHDELWKSSARSLKNLETVLTNIKLKLKLLNYREIAKEMYNLNVISKEDYVEFLKELWNNEEIYGEFDDVFIRETES